VDGFLFVDKPSGPTSFDVVRQVRLALGGEKTGHAGTLDPLASGLLVCGLGSATRLLPYLPSEPKRYAFGIRFGAETDTLDSEGSVVAQGGRLPAQEELQAVLGRFTGVVRQTPPKFSAVKVNGERAYDLARKHREFEIAERQVTVFSLFLVSYDGAKAEAALEVACSGGTYVRSLVQDIARALGTFAHASFIRRLAIGPFTVDNAIDTGSVKDLREHIMPVREALSSLPSVTVSDTQCETLGKGRSIKLDMTDIIVMAYKESGDVVAVLKKNDEGLFHPEKVFIKL
jgi:tRNA pseudouridine55 synthase